jgi:hypothetical protein
MQVAAWGKMFAGYSGTMSIAAALRETFDASKPCDMCIGIAKAKHATEKELPATEQQASSRFVLALHVVNEPVFANDRGSWMNPPLAIVRERTDPVPVPPPRV